MIKEKYYQKYEALKCLQDGVLKIFPARKKIDRRICTNEKGINDWLLMKRHDEFALYNYQVHVIAG